MAEIAPGSESTRDTQNAAMHRVRDLLERDRIGREREVAQRPWWPRIVGLLLAAGVVGIFALGLDAFLAVFQRMLDTPTDTPAQQQASPSADTAMPVFVVPEEPPAQTGGQPSEPGKPSG
jgi:hypothetical protein